MAKNSTNNGRRISDLHVTPETIERSVNGAPALAVVSPRPDFRSEVAHDPPARSANTSDLPVRRKQVEQLLRRGMSNKAIADQVGLCEPTLKNYIRAIYAGRGTSTAREYFASLLQSKD